MITWAELNAVAQHMDEHPVASGPMYAPVLLGWTRALLNEVERLKLELEQAKTTIAAINQVFGNAAAFDPARGDVVEKAKIAYNGALAGDRARIEASVEINLLKAERKAIAETANNLNRENADLRDMIAEVQRACDKARSAPAYDNPDLDGTDGAHPAWWRGNDHGIRTTIREVNAWLSGAPLHGTYGQQELNWLRARIAELVAERKGANAEYETAYREGVRMATAHIDAALEVLKGKP